MTPTENNLAGALQKEEGKFNAYCNVFSQSNVKIIVERKNVI